MLVNERFEKITQRTHPNLAEFKIKLDSNEVCIEHGSEHVVLQLNSEGDGEFIQSKVWDDPVIGIRVDKILDEFFSDILKEKAQLIQKKGSRINTLPNNLSVASSFADSLPLLVAGTSSLKSIQDTLAVNFNMLHFRPNLVLKTKQPFIEDHVLGFQIGTTEIRFGKKCGRCSMVNVNFEDGSINKNRLKELGKIRLENNKIYFGSLFYPTVMGTLNEGDQIQPIFD
jgi:hypothetical protein